MPKIENIQAKIPSPQNCNVCCSSPVRACVIGILESDCRICVRTALVIAAGEPLLTRIVSPMLLDEVYANGRNRYPEGEGSRSAYIRRSPTTPMTVIHSFS